MQLGVECFNVRMLLQRNLASILTDFVDFEIYSPMVFAVTPPWDFLTPPWNFALNRKIPHCKNYAVEAVTEECYMQPVVQFPMIRPIMIPR